MLHMPSLPCCPAHLLHMCTRWPCCPAPLLCTRWHAFGFQAQAASGLCLPHTPRTGECRHFALDSCAAAVDLYAQPYHARILQCKDLDSAQWLRLLVAIHARAVWSEAYVRPPVCTFGVLTHTPSPVCTGPPKDTCAAPPLRKPSTSPHCTYRNVLPKPSTRPHCTFVCGMGRWT